MTQVLCYYFSPCFSTPSNPNSSAGTTPGLLAAGQKWSDRDPEIHAKANAGSKPGEGCRALGLTHDPQIPRASSCHDC